MGFVTLDQISLQDVYLILSQKLSYLHLICNPMIKQKLQQESDLPRAFSSTVTFHFAPFLPVLLRLQGVALHTLALTFNFKRQISQLRKLKPTKMDTMRCFALPAQLMVGLSTLTTSKLNKIPCPALQQLLQRQLRTKPFRSIKEPGISY